MPGRTGYRKRAAGYTMMELLAVMLIFTVLLVMALVMYSSATRDAYRKACRANLQSIANADEQWRIKNPNHTYTSTLNNLAGEMGGIPICPSGGTYSLSVSQGGNLTVTCSYASGTPDAHGGFALGVDNE